MKRIVLIGLFSAFLSLAQSEQIRWGEVETFTPQAVQIMHNNGNGFYLIYSKGHVLGPLFPNLRKTFLREVISLNTVQETELEFVNGSGKELAPRALNNLNNSVYVFSSKLTNGGLRNEVYLHRFSAMNPTKKVKGDLLVSYYRKETPLSFKEMGVVKSPQNTAVASFLTIPVNPIDFQGFGYAVYDDKGAAIQSKIMALPFKMFELDISEVVVSETGTLYISGDQFFGQQYQDILNPTNRTYGCERILLVRNDTLRDITPQNDQAILTNQKLSFDQEGNLLVSGFYSDAFFTSYRGVFFMKIDSKSDSILSLVKQPFTAQFLNQEFQSWERPQTNISLVPQHPEQSLNDFKMRAFEQFSDGSYIGVAENEQTIFIPRMSGSPQTPRITYDEEKQMNDLLVYKLDSLGQLVWAKRIPKSQKGVNADNRFLSATICITDESVHLFFNDLARNYDNSGKFIENQAPYPVRIVSRSNVIASVRLDLNDGSVKRVSLPGLSSNDVIFNPNNSVFYRQTNEVIFYGEYNRKNRFGYLKLK